MHTKMQFIRLSIVIIIYHLWTSNKNDPTCDFCVVESGETVG